MFIYLYLIKVDNKLFIPTLNPETNYEKGDLGSISAEFYALLIIMGGKKIKFKNYYYFAIVNDGFVIILREKEKDG